jgi:phage repressor protein C with HTH and peptisase S24 domain
MNERLRVLGQRIADAIGGRDRASEFERQCGGVFTRMTLQRWIDGKTFPDVAELQDLADEVKRPISWFLGLEGPQFPGRPGADVVMVPILDVEAAAGEGIAVDVVKAEAEFAFPFYFLQKLLGDDAGHAKLSSLRANGHSMEPTIRNRGLVIIDEAQKEFPEIPTNAKMRRAEPNIYVFFTSSGLRLKRIKPIDERFAAIISDNVHIHPPEIFHHGTDGKITIIGKVIWWDNRL